MNTSESLYKAAITEINEHLNQARAASRNNDLGNALKHALAAIDAQAHLIRHLIARRLAFIAGFASVAFAGSLVKAEPAQEASTDPSSHRISYDSYSLKIDGKRIFLYSGEIHPYRLPSPSLWRDVLEKINAAGFNGISVYSYWGYHSPSPGKYFTGIRNMDSFLDLANEIGLYVIARPCHISTPKPTAAVSQPGWLVSPAISEVQRRDRKSDAV